MEKALIALISVGTLIVSCTVSYFMGYHQGYNHVIHNQYAEECPDNPNCYHIVINGNIHEYEVDNNTTTISTTGTFTFYDYTYNSTSNDGTDDIYDDILISVTAAK